MGTLCKASITTEHNDLYTQFYPKYNKMQYKDSYLQPGNNLLTRPDAFNICLKR